MPRVLLVKLPLWMIVLKYGVSKSIPLCWPNHEPFLGDHSYRPFVVTLEIVCNLQLNWVDHDLAHEPSSSSCICFRIFPMTLPKETVPSGKRTVCYWTWPTIPNLRMVISIATVDGRCPNHQLKTVVNIPFKHPFGDAGSHNHPEYVI